MSDRDDADTDALDEGALLAAYLDGDTDDVTTRRLERRLAADADLAARLDAVAATRSQLQRLERITTPEDVRQRLTQHLAQQRVASASATPQSARKPRPRWTMRFAPIAAAAAIVLLAVFGAAAVLPRLSEGAGESSAASADGGNAAAEDSAVDEAGGGDGGLEAAGAAPEAEGGEAAPQALSDPTAGDARAAAPEAPAPVSGDADIAARAERLLEDPPANLQRRERRLRRDAGLPVELSCVGDLDASTVDLVTTDGRTSLAVLLDDDPGQIVLIDPKTCAPIRMITRD